jgi:hypothetical protein
MKSPTLHFAGETKPSLLDSRTIGQNDDSKTRHTAIRYASDKSLSRLPQLVLIKLQNRKAYERIKVHL